MLNTTVKRKCRKCKAEKLLIKNFNKSKSGKDGYNNICKNCVKKLYSVSKKETLRKISNIKSNNAILFVVDCIGVWLSVESKKIIIKYYTERYKEIVSWLEQNREDGLVYLLGVEGLGLGSKEEFFGKKDWSEIEDEWEREVISHFEEYIENLICKVVVRNMVDGEIMDLVKKMKKRI